MDKISDIVQEKRVVRVFLDSGEELLFCKALWHQAPPMRVNDEVHTEELKDWMLTVQYPYALHYAIDLLSRKPCSTGEIRQKLRLRHDSEQTIEMVLYKLEKERLVNDREFAESYATACVRKRYGKNRIRFSLQQKGISREMAEEVLEGLEQEEQDYALGELAEKLLRHYSGESDPRKKRAKLLAALARRGYGFDESREAIDRLL